MGNCSFKGVINNFENLNSIRVLKESGEILDFKGPKTVRDVLNEYPGCRIFRRGDTSSFSPPPPPLSDEEHLVVGTLYYLLPLVKEEVECLATSQAVERRRMSSAEFVDKLSDEGAIEALPAGKKGVWKVKLVINVKQLEEILSEEVNIEALIEKMRMVASSASSGSGSGSDTGSECVTPKRRMSSWVVGRRRALCFSNVFKLPVINC